MLRWRTAPILAALALALSACGSGGAGTPKDTGTGAAGSCDYRESGQASKTVRLPPAVPDASNPTRMVVTTSAGDVPIVFDTAAAPCTVNSFVSLARQGYFNNTVCHRLITSGIYVLQCGDPTATGTGGPGYTIPDEIIAADSRLEPCDPTTDRCTYSNGYVAVAGIGPPHSGGSQFFFVYRESQLQPTFPVFGHTNAGGLKVLQQIAALGTADGAVDGPPRDPVTILSVR